MFMDDDVKICCISFHNIQCPQRQTKSQMQDNMKNQIHIKPIFTQIPYYIHAPNH